MEQLGSGMSGGEESGAGREKHVCVCLHVYLHTHTQFATHRMRRVEAGDPGAGQSRGRRHADLCTVPPQKESRHLPSGAARRTE